MAQGEAMVIQEIIAPAAMIPACGLLLLSSTARLNTVLGRMRAFHSERLDVWKRTAEGGTRDDAVRSLRLEGLEHQTHRLLDRARLLKITMLQLFGAITCNLLSVIGLGLRFVVDDPGGALSAASVSVFVIGIVAMLGAMGTSVAEVLRITETVEYEHERVERLCASDAPATNGSGSRAGALDEDAGEGVGL